MSDLPTLPITFRPSRTRAVLLTAGASILVVITTVAMLLEQLGPGSGSASSSPRRCSSECSCCSRPKVVADESGVTVVNITSRRHLDWAEIVQVNLRPGDPWVFLDLSDGTSLPALGIQPGIARQRAIEDARALRALAFARGIQEPDGHRDEHQG